ncbi:hypothetical protein AOQ84DRAFT_160234 [Glonium stellatum]|uniref:Uncharacterized protein n=1 Tax=Glonium stellatum TaxID=574774 RepID=A0A8E2ER67_9PEZI|nr:hypothetical protein AOQ84DRAFT_160234 [Glonium stellatum]
MVAVGQIYLGALPWYFALVLCLPTWYKTLGSARVEPCRVIGTSSSHSGPRLGYPGTLKRQNIKTSKHQNIKIVDHKSVHDAWNPWSSPSPTSLWCKTSLVAMSPCCMRAFLPTPILVEFFSLIALRSRYALAGRIEHGNMYMKIKKQSRRYLP